MLTRVFQIGAEQIIARTFADAIHQAIDRAREMHQMGNRIAAQALYNEAIRLRIENHLDSGPSGSHRYARRRFA